LICHIYRSEKKPGAYLYLACEKTIEDVPEELQKMLGVCVQVMQLNLAKRSQLASEDIDLVKANLNQQGYHLQMPPKVHTQVIDYGV